MENVPLRCACGSLRGTVRGLAPDAGFRVVCYCDDCQAFARYLGQTERMLDALGGTEIFQTSPAKVQLETGSLACMRLSPRGLLRWHSGCCRSPIGNTPPMSGLPFVGLIRTSLETSDEVLGPVRARVQTRFASGDVSGPHTHDRAPLSMLPRLMGRIALSRIRREHLASPFFDSSGKPAAVATILSKAERRDLGE